jgi:DNA-binding CsgD family transcriptional regulator
MIPAGLTDNNLEFFSLNGELYSLSNGIRHQIPECPVEHLQFLQNQLDADPIAQETLTNVPDDHKLKVYGICRFGACNSTPDGVDNNCIDKTEYFDCGIRGRCEFEGKRCKELVTDAGVLSFRQLQIMILVSRGLLNKEIADQLNISENTVANHLANIHPKIGGRTRVDIATFVKERDIA